MRFGVLAALSLLIPISAAAGDVNCAFRRTIVVGASVSAETMRNLDPGQRLLVSLANRAGGGHASTSAIVMDRTYGPNPIRHFMPDFGRSEIILNKAARFSWPTGTSQLFDLVYGRSASLDYLRKRLVAEPDSRRRIEAEIAELEQVDPVNRTAFASATAIVGIDAFDWNAAFDRGERRSTCDERALRTVSEFLAEARARRKVVALGNLPKEDPARVSCLRSPLGRLFVNSVPNPSCVDRTNALLARERRPENQFYLIDFDGAVARLSRGERLTFDGRELGNEEIRPDGLHLSPAGSALVAQELRELLLWRPPDCAASPDS